MNKMSVSYLEFIAAIIIFACIVILSTREKTTDAPEQSQPNAKNAAISSSANEKNLHLKYSEHQQHTRTKPMLPFPACMSTSCNYCRPTKKVK
jgi:hypothetical protein